MKSLPIVYIAGPINDTNQRIVERNKTMFHQAHAEINATKKATAYNPALDSHIIGMIMMVEDVAIEDCYRWSMPFAERADALLMLPGWKESTGALLEHKRAKELGIRIFYNMDDLMSWIDGLD